MIKILFNKRQKNPKTVSGSLIILVGDETLTDPLPHTVTYVNLSLLFVTVCARVSGVSGPPGDAQAGRQPAGAAADQPGQDDQPRGALRRGELPHLSPAEVSHSLLLVIMATSHPLIHLSLFQYRLAPAAPHTQRGRK